MGTSVLHRLKSYGMDDKNVVQRATGIYTFLNPRTYLVHNNRPSLLDRFDGLFLDGIGLCLVLRITGVRNLDRVSFDMSSLAGTAFRFAVTNSRSVYLIGTTSPLIERAANNIRARFPKLNLAGYRHGYFQSENELRSVVDNIVTQQPELVVVGMGAPLQEEFLVTLQEAGWTGLGFTCGGFFHQAAEQLNYYPRIVNELELRWIWRLWKESGRLTRFVKCYPRFVVQYGLDFYRLKADHRSCG